MKNSTHMASSPDQLRAAHQLPRDIKLVQTKPLSTGAFLFWFCIAVLAAAGIVGAIGWDALVVLGVL